MTRHLLALALLPVGAAVALFADVFCGSLVVALGMVASACTAPAMARHVSESPDASTGEA